MPVPPAGPGSLLDRIPSYRPWEIRSFNYLSSGFLCDKNRFPSKSEMIEFVQTAGFMVSKDPKSSRLAIARRIIKQAEKNPKDKKKLNDAVYRSGNCETKGWLDLSETVLDVKHTEPS